MLSSIVHTAHGPLPMVYHYSGYLLFSSHGFASHHICEGILCPPYDLCSLYPCCGCFLQVSTTVRFTQPSFANILSLLSASIDIFYSSTLHDIHFPLQLCRHLISLCEHPLSLCGCFLVCATSYSSINIVQACSLPYFMAHNYVGSLLHSFFHMGLFVTRLCDIHA